LGNDLYEQVFYSLDLIEKDYFGLQYTDANHVQHWLDGTKPIKKQVKSKCVICLCVLLFYVTSINGHVLNGLYGGNSLFSVFSSKVLIKCSVNRN